jgi:hypothetical protein
MAVRHGGQRGQALVAVLLVVVVAGAAWEALGLASAASRDRLALEAGLEAGATVGAAVLADGLNTVAVTNVALLALGTSALLGFGEGAAWAVRLQEIQDQVVKGTPVLAKQLAWATAMANGAQLARPLPGVEGKWPDLMVRRVYFLKPLFGTKFPLWLADDLHEVGGRRWGNRVVFVEGWGTARWRALPLPLHSRTGAAASRTGGGASGWPLLWPSFDGRLIPCPGKGGADR